MSGTTPLTTGLFCTLVLVVLAVVVVALRRAGVRAGNIVGLILAYLAVPGLLAGVGVLDRYNPLPAPALLLMLGLTALTAFLTLGKRGAEIAAATPLAFLIVLQAFRIDVEWLLHRLFLERVVPVQMTYAGRNWDVITGITGLLLGGWLLSGRSAPRWLVIIWNVVGLGLLLNIVIIAVLSTPVPFRRFLAGPPNLLPSSFPYVWLPSFLVELALASHLLVFRKLRGADHREIRR